MRPLESTLAPIDKTRAHLVELLRRSRRRWFKTTEVHDILLNYKVGRCKLKPARERRFQMQYEAPCFRPGPRVMTLSQVETRDLKAWFQRAKVQYN